MKVLIASDSKQIIDSFLAYIKLDEPYKGTYKHIHIDVIFTGYTDFEAAYRLGKALDKDRYHLVLYAGYAHSLNKMMKVGQVVNVVNEIPYAYGIKTEKGFKNAYQLAWLNSHEHPHKRNGFINLTNAYFNIFLPIMKSAGISCKTLGGNTSEIAEKTKHFPMHVESVNGLSVHYACASSNANFYQLRAIRHNYISNTTNESLAKQNLNNELIRIIDLL